MKVTEYKDKTVIDIDKPCQIVVECAGETVFEVSPKYAPEPATPTPEPETTPTPVYDLNSTGGIMALYLSRHMDIPQTPENIDTLRTWAAELLRQLGQQGQTLVGMSPAQQTSLIDQMLGHWKQGPST